MASSIPGNSGIASPVSVVRSRSVDLLAWALHRAVTDADSSLTIQEGLYKAYTRDLLCLAGVDGVPDALRESIDAIVRTLGEALGFDSVTGQKKGPSTLGERDAAALLAHLRTVSAAVEKIAARS
jgi:hypothetical protein